YVIFASWLLYGMTTAAVLVLRRKRSDLIRPYRTFGYPVVPVLFVAIALCLVISTLFDSPRESFLGLGLIFAGLPFYFHWRKQRTALQKTEAEKTACRSDLLFVLDFVLNSEQST